MLTGDKHKYALGNDFVSTQLSACDRINCVEKTRQDIIIRTALLAVGDQIVYEAQKVSSPRYRASKELLIETAPDYPGELHNHAYALVRSRERFRDIVIPRTANKIEVLAEY